MFKRIVIATDGSDISRRAGRQALALAKTLGAAIQAVSVIDTRALASVYPGVPEVAPVYPGLLDDLRKAAGAAAEEVTRAASQDGIPAGGEVLEGSPASAILEAADRFGADLVVMGTHGRSSLGALLLGSTAQAVVHRAKVPVLLVR